MRQCLGYLYMNSDKEGVLYHFKTPSLAKFNSFLASKYFGIYRLNYGYSILISEKEAKEKAKIIAKNLPIIN